MSENGAVRIEVIEWAPTVVVVDGRYCCVVDRLFFYSFFWKIVVCTACTSQAYFMTLSPRLSVTDTICLHF